MRCARFPWLLAFLGVACAQELAQSEPRAPRPPEPSTRAEAAPAPHSALPPTESPPAAAEGPSAPALTNELLALRARAQRHLLGAGNEIEDHLGQRSMAKVIATEEATEYAADGNALGNFIEIENPTALDSFYLGLKELSEGRLATSKLRVLAYGASHTQGDFFTGYLRHYLQSRFGNGGLGFMQFARVNDYYRSADATVDSKGFHIEHVQRKDAPEHGRFGLLGAAAVSMFSYSRASIERSSRASQVALGTSLDLYYMNEPKGGDFALSVDGARVLRVSTQGEKLSPGYATVELPPNWNQLSIQATNKRAFRLFGGVLETADPGIVIDTLGINGTRAANMLAWDETLWREHVARRDPRLVILAYGTNEAVDSKQPISEYEANLRQVIARVQAAAPSASCLLVGPGDFPKEIEGGYVPRPRLLDIVDVQRKLAFELGCGFFDTLEFMGGEGSMLRWSRALPPMGAQDRIHLTARGYVRWGMVLGDALMLPLDGAKPQGSELTALR